MQGTHEFVSPKDQLLYYKKIKKVKGKLDDWYVENIYPSINEIKDDGDQMNDSFKFLRVKVTEWCSLGKRLPLEKNFESEEEL